MQKALTWQQVVCILLGLAIFMFAVLRFGANIDDDTRQIGLYGLAVTVPTFVFVLISHFRRVKKEDLYPDLLATIVPEQSILQVGHCHFHIMSSCFETGELFVGVLAQNLLDGEGELRLRFKSSVRDVVVPELHCVLPPAGLIRATIKAPSGASDRPYKCQLALLADYKGKGAVIRFGRRAFASRPVNPAITVLGLLGGAIYAGGGTFVNFDVPAHAHPPTAPNAPAAEWELDEIWSLEDWPDVEIAKTRLAEPSPAQAPA